MRTTLIEFDCVEDYADAARLRDYLRHQGVGIGEGPKQWIGGRMLVEVTGTEEQLAKIINNDDETREVIL